MEEVNNTTAYVVYFIFGLKFCDISILFLKNNANDRPMNIYKVCNHPSAYGKFENLKFVMSNSVYATYHASEKLSDTNSILVIIKPKNIKLHAI